MRFELRFEPDALKEWQALDKSVREPLKKKLAKTGHRLVYRVIDEQVVVLVLAIGKRERLEAYLKAAQRNSAAS
jgi:mRNA interferase RelE/StbE